MVTHIFKDGTTSNEFYAFRIMYLGNKKFAAGNTQVKAGDEVIICGKVVNFKGNTPETVQNKAYLYSLNGTTASQDTPTPEPTEGEPKGSGTQADPFNVLAALNYTTALGADKESDKEVYIKGKVSTIKFNYVADNYGNATFYISDDATTNNEFYCYRVLYIGNQKYTGSAIEPELEVKAGSLCAYKTATKPGIRQQESNLCGTPVAIFQLGPDFKGSSAYNTMPWCINQNTDDPEAMNDFIIKMKPGITGPWQVAGRSNLTFEDRLKLDEEYCARRGNRRSCRSAS